MKFLKYPLFILGSVISAIGFASKGSSMEPAQIHKLVQAGKAILLDVREESELKASGIAEGAAWLPTSKISENHEDWQDFKKKLPKDKEIVIYCAVGGRAGRVAELLSQEGYHTHNMGGLKEWQAAKLPVKKFP